MMYLEPAALLQFTLALAVCSQSLDISSSGGIVKPEDQQTDNSTKTTTSPFPNDTTTTRSGTSTDVDVVGMNENVDGGERSNDTEEVDVGATTHARRQDTGSGYPKIGVSNKTSVPPPMLPLVPHWNPVNQTAEEFQKAVCRPIPCPTAVQDNSFQGTERQQSNGSNCPTGDKEVKQSSCLTGDTEVNGLSSQSPEEGGRSRREVTEQLNQESSCLAVDCFQCDCSDGCAAYGTCCDDVETEENESLNSVKSTVDCVIRGQYYSYYSIARCPAGWSGDKTTRQACEEGTGHYTHDEPVTDAAGLVVYRNAACARCHGVHDHKAWDLELTCGHFQFLYTSVSKHEFLERASAAKDTCSMWLSPPKGTFPSGCNPLLWSSLPPIQECNMTRQWAEYDLQVETACHALTAWTDRVFHPNATLIFANVFCAICNGLKLETSCDSLFVDIKGSGYAPTDDHNLAPGAIHQAPLSLLFGLRDPQWNVDVGVAVDCPAGSVLLAPSNECRNLTCTAGKALVNGTCSTVISQIRGLVYMLDASFVLSSPIRTSYFNALGDVLLEEIGQELVNSLRNHTRGITVIIMQETRQIETTDEKKTTDANETLPALPYETRRVRIVGNITASREISRDEAEQTLVDVLFKDGWNITINNANFSLKPQSVSNATQRVEETNSLFLNEALDFSYPLDEPFADELKVKLSPVLACPYVVFNQSEFAVHTNEGSDEGSSVVVLITEDHLTTVPQVEDGALLTWVDEDRLYVCQKALSKMHRQRKAGERSWQTILSLVVLPLSMLCLLLTLLVYSLLPALRTMPGLNTMGTCVALLVAQLSLILASEGVLSGVNFWCRALGVMVHESWLSVFCWNSLCSLHMFRAFSAKTFHRSSSGLRLRLARNIALTVLGPGAVVAAVVVGSYVSSGGVSMGYSNVRCYLNSPVLVGLTLVLPVALLLAVNLILFALTVRRIHLVSKLNPHSDKDKESQNHVNVCVRLSVLTGAFWVLSLVAETLDIDWLKVFSIVANGGQGVLLFLSYVITRRVYVMLASRLGLREKVSSEHTTSTTAHTKHSPDLEATKIAKHQKAGEFSDIAK